MSVVCPRGHLLRHVRRVAAIYPCRAMNSLDSMEQAVRRAQPRMIIPCDDWSVRLLHELYTLRPALRPLIAGSLGAPESFATAEHRALLLEAADGLGIRVPVTRTASSEADVAAWFAAGETSAVLKVDGSSGGEGVVFAHSEREALEAWRRLAQPAGWAKTFKRVAINREPLRLRADGDDPPSLTLQQFVPGRPANVMFACQEGEILCIAVVEVLASQGATGAAVLARRIRHPEIERASRLLARRLGLSGFYGLDFLLDDRGGAHLLEMNPRCTQLGHLHFSAEVDLAAALYTKLTGRSPASVPPAIGDRPVAFFPMATRLCPGHPLLDEAYMDLPRDQPELVRELNRPAWPERRWLARLYHHFRPPERVSAAVFAPPGESSLTAAADPAGAAGVSLRHSCEVSTGCPSDRELGSWVCEDSATQETGWTTTRMPD